MINKRHNGGGAAYGFHPEREDRGFFLGLGFGEGQNGYTSSGYGSGAGCIFGSCMNMGTSYGWSNASNCRALEGGIDLGNCNGEGVSCD